MMILLVLIGKTLVTFEPIPKTCSTMECFETAVWVNNPRQKCRELKKKVKRCCQRSNPPEVRNLGCCRGPDCEYEKDTLDGETTVWNVEVRGNSYSY